MNIIQHVADLLIRNLFHADPAVWSWTWLVQAVVIGIAAFLAFAFVAIFAGPVSWIERRIAARIQSRVGPNRVGPQGILQWLADGVKCWLKEDLVPATADKPLFLAAPYLVFTGMFGAFVVLPFGANVVAADLNVGILYILAITSLVVVGLLMAGWGSNSKWALFGGVRSAAQLVSYEVPSAFSLLTVVLLAGTLSTQGIVAAQGGWPWQWFIFRNPFMFAAFFLYFTSAIAEGNRTPFDLPEAESEIIAGYNIEYSGMRFLFFLFAEWANIWIMTRHRHLRLPGRLADPRRHAGPDRRRQGLVLRGLAGAVVDHLPGQGDVPGLRRHPDPLDAAAPARRPAHDHLLEVPGAAVDGDGAGRAVAAGPGAGERDRRQDPALRHGRRGRRRRPGFRAQGSPDLPGGPRSLP